MKEGTPGEENGARAIHAQLRAAILENRLQAGEVISQVRLAETLSVSRTPLREAIRLLEREGLLTAQHNRRVRIAPFRVDELEDIYAMRISLESLAARHHIPLLSPETVEQIRDAHEAMLSAAKAEDYEAWEQPHRRFHALMMSNAGERFQMEMRQLSDHAERYRYACTTRAPMAWENSIAEHGALFESVVDADGDRAAELVARHYARVALDAMTMLAPEYEPRLVREALRTAIRGSAGSSRPAPARSSRRPAATGGRPAGPAAGD